MWKKTGTNMNCELRTACIFLGDKWSLQEELQNVTMRSLPYHKHHDGLSFEIYRKPTATDIIIPNDSCHLREHKTAAIGYYCNRLKTSKLTPESRQKERDNIQQILVNNKYDISSLKKFNKEKRQRQRKQPETKVGKFYVDQIYYKTV